MNKGSWISLAIVVLLAGAYPGLAWYSGKTVETRLKDYRARMLVQAPYLTVASQKYERGIYRSHEEITYEFGRSLFGALAAAGAASGKGGPDFSRGFSFTIRSAIRHGPFPGFGAPALAKIETEFVMTEATRKDLARAFGTRKPIEIVTLLKYDGGGVTEISSPAFDHFALGKNADTLSWQGFKATVEFGRDLAWIKTQGTAPGMEVNAPDKESVKLETVAFASNSELAFGDLYIGDASMSVKSMNVLSRRPATGEDNAPGPKQMTLDGVEYGGKLARKDEFLDLNGKFRIAGLDIDVVKLSDLHYEVTLKHMHGPTVAELARLLRKTLADASLLADSKAGSTLEKDFKRLGIELLKRDPELMIDRISFAMPEGDAKMNGSVHIVGFDPADLESAGGPMTLLPKLDARVDISIAEGLLEKISASGDHGSLAMFEQQLAALEARGYVTRADGRLVTHIEFREGALTFNGKAYVPPAPPPPGAPGKPTRDTTHT